MKKHHKILVAVLGSLFLVYLVVYFMDIHVVGIGPMTEQEEEALVDKKIGDIGRRILKEEGCPQETDLTNSFLRLKYSFELAKKTPGYEKMTKDEQWAVEITKELRLTGIHSEPENAQRARILQKIIQYKNDLRKSNPEVFSTGY